MHKKGMLTWHPMWQSGVPYGQVIQLARPRVHLTWKDNVHVKIPAYTSATSHRNLLSTLPLKANQSKMPKLIQIEIGCSK